MVTGGGLPPLPPPARPGRDGRSVGQSGGSGWCRRAMGPRRLLLGGSPLVVLLFFFLGVVRPGWALQDVTAQLFGDQAFGTVAAFGDFNSDKQTDIFVLRGGESLGEAWV